MAPAAGTQVEGEDVAADVILSPIAAAHHVQDGSDDGAARVVAGPGQTRQQFPAAGGEVVRRHGVHGVLYAAGPGGERSERRPPVGARVVRVRVAQGLPGRATGQAASAVGWMPPITYALPSRAAAPGVAGLVVERGSWGSQGQRGQECRAPAQDSASAHVAVS
nr:hypothetical protein [Streptomyces sp. NRRL B-1347]